MPDPRSKKLLNLVYKFLVQTIGYYLDKLCLRHARPRIFQLIEHLRGVPSSGIRTSDDGATPTGTSNKRIKSWASSTASVEFVKIFYVLIRLSSHKFCIQCFTRTRCAEYSHLVPSIIQSFRSSPFLDGYWYSDLHQTLSFHEPLEGTGLFR